MEKKQIVIEEAKRLAEDYGLLNLTREQVCEASNIAVGSFTSIVGKSFGEFVNELRDMGYPLGELDTRKRANPTLRKESLLQTALKLAEVQEGGYPALTRDTVAKECGISTTLLSQYFGSVAAFRAELVGYAIIKEHLPVILQALIFDHPLVAGVRREVKLQALQRLIEKIG